jgi:hypothetical protein
MHYHIHWSNGKVDWERFTTRFDAESDAKKLVLLGETYTVEEYDDATCPQCPGLIPPMRVTDIPGWRVP